jgi:Ca-activated chloride channel family protein
MGIPFKRKTLYQQNDFFSQHSSVLAAGLVTVILVGCGAKVAEDQAVHGTTGTGQVVSVDSLPVPVSNQQLAVPLEAPGRRDNDGNADIGQLSVQPRAEVEEVVVTGSSVRAGNSVDAASPLVQSPSQAPAENRSPTLLAEPSSVQSTAVTVASEQLQDTVSSTVYRQGVQEHQLRSGPALTIHAPPPFLHHTGPAVDRENYLEVEENSVKLVAEHPVSTFSIDVDTAGYSNVRRMIMNEGRLPPHDAVRVEEMINYFSYDYPVPDSIEEPLAIHTELAASPWNPANKLLMVGIQGYEPAPGQRPDANLVFLVDVSGSMNSADKLGLVQRSLKLLVDQMRPSDRIALVVYAGAAGMVLDSTPANHKNHIKHAIDSLRAGGSTNGAAGIQLAYQIAERHKIDGGINRVIIASDGDLNVGMTDIDDLKELIGKKRENDIALTTLGFGTGNYNYSLMEQIADVGNGNAAYIDSLSEARKVLVEEMQSTLLTIAKDVKIQIEFNPSVVKEYRLLGYENRLLNREDFANDKVDAGEIGAGHTVTALYEVTLVSSGGGLFPDSRYNRQPVTDDDDLGNEVAFVKIRHKPADGDVSTESGRPVLLSDNRTENVTTDSFRFAAAVAGFGQLLRGGRYTRDFGYDEVLALARNARGDDPQGYRSELVKLVEMAKLL